MAIDIENEIYSSLNATLLSLYDGIFVTGEELSVPEKPLCVSIVEADNYCEKDTTDSSGQENYATLMYETNTYSNKKTGKKTESKSVANTIDSEMNRLGFTRLSRTAYTQNGYYRIVARYTAKVSKNKEIFRR